MSSGNGLMRRLGNTLLVVMFVTIMVISLLAITSAYSSLQLSIRMIDVTLIEVSRHLQENAPTKDGDLTPDLKAFREQLRSEAKGVLDSSTISFLFTVFSLALVTAGVYLLSRTHSNLTLAEKRSTAAAKFITDNSLACAIEGFTSPAYSSSFALRSATGPAISTALPHSRKTLTQLHNKLIIADQQKIGIDPLLHESFLDRTKEVLENLESRRSNLGDRINDLVDTCQKCIHILEMSGFVKRYEEQRSQLLGTSSCSKS